MAKPLHVLIACDKFKGSIDAAGVANALTQAFYERLGAERLAVDSIVMSDGGDGFFDALKHPLSLTPVSCRVTGSDESLGACSWVVVTITFP
jgi:glycerate kinase